MELKMGDKLIDGLEIINNNYEFLFGGIKCLNNTRPKESKAKEHSRCLVIRERRAHFLHNKHNHLSRNETFILETEQLRTVKILELPKPIISHNAEFNLKHE